MQLTCSSRLILSKVRSQLGHLMVFGLGLRGLSDGGAWARRLRTGNVVDEGTVKDESRGLDGVSGDAPKPSGLLREAVSLFIAGWE